MQNDSRDIVKRQLEEKDIRVLKKAMNTLYKRFGASIFFFLLFITATFILYKHPLQPAQKGAEGLEKVPLYVLCFLDLMMFIAIARGLWGLYMINSDKDAGEKLCGTAVYKRAFSINKVPYLLLEFDRRRLAPIFTWPGRQMPRGEQVYVEVAPHSSVFFVVRHLDREIEINIEKTHLSE